MKSRLIGISSYTRDSVYGSIFTIGISIPSYSIECAKKMGVDKYKTLDKKTLDDLANEVIESFDFSVTEIKAEDISMGNINTLEIHNYIHCYNELQRKKNEIVYARSIGIPPSEIVEKIKLFSKNKIDTSVWTIVDKSNTECLPCLMSLFLAKYYYDFYLDDIKKKYSTMGAGKPSSKRTREYLRTNMYKYPSFVRINYELINECGIRLIM